MFGKITKSYNSYNDYFTQQVVSGNVANAQGLILTQNFNPNYYTKPFTNETPYTIAFNNDNGELVKILCPYFDLTIYEILAQAITSQKNNVFNVMFQFGWFNKRLNEEEVRELLMHAVAVNEPIASILLGYVNTELVFVNAVEKNKETVVKFLIKNKVNFNFFYGNKSLVYMAAERGHVDILQTLLDEDALVHEKSPFMAAIDNNQFLALEVLLNELPQTSLSYLFSLLSITVKNNQPEGYKIILEKISEIKKLDEALILAAKEGSAFMVTLLLAHGANVNACIAGETPLFAAARNHHDAVVQLLKTKNADVTFAVKTAEETIHRLQGLMTNSNIIPFANSDRFFLEKKKDDYSSDNSDDDNTMTF